ncbi:MAG: hypothetical protein WED04_12430 [Promethearchaeati archaeon SRVP18_Atabeyarchaeia-1]
MSESIALSLREVIFKRVAESNGCYLLIYSGSVEKLSFLSSLFRRPKDDSVRLLVDFDLGQYASGLASDGCIIVSGLSGKHVDESPESFCLNVIRRNIREYADTHGELSRIIIVVDCSQISADVQEPLANGALSFHKELVDLIKSIDGATGVLMYNIDFLSDNLMSKLLKFHGKPTDSESVASLQSLKQDMRERSKNTDGAAEILVQDEGILFINPVTKSATFLAPCTDAIGDILPRDPLNIAHRDIAFANNYTAQEGACPYLSQDVPSQCLLDPRVVMVVNTRGRSFVQGLPCVTAIDHMILEEKPQKEEPKERRDAPEAEDGRSTRSSESNYGTDFDSRKGGGSSLTPKAA